MPFKFFLSIYSSNQKEKRYWRTIFMTAFGAMLLSGCVSPTQSVSSSQASTSQTQLSSSSLIVSFSWPVKGMGTEDTNTSASIVIDNGILEGNTAYAASLIQQETGLNWITLEVEKEYPIDYEELVDQAAQEQKDKERPLLREIPDLSGYDEIILVTPNWWSDLPMPVYTFLENEDWSNKTIVPVVIHGGSGFSNILSTLENYAAIDKDHTLSISRSQLLDAEQEIRTWADQL